ncbi:MAG: M23 family metallopeptidase [Bacteroidales bacterium]|nr:M23 family metallopeptidase [Bacteroidales bacterium]
MTQKLLIALFLLISPEGPEKTATLSPPLDIPLLLSANFGEPRSNHFHSGLDFKTEGVTGKMIYAASDGHVYRLVVSPTGFGKALYIRHKNGLSTVYGHLDAFTPEIEKYVRKYQYENRRFDVNLFPHADEFTVNEGDIIGYSGNTGSSMGPHLHFEVRRSSDEKPLNPAQFYDIEDNIRPVINAVAVYPAGISSLVNGKKEKLILKTRGNGGKYTSGIIEPVRIHGPVGFGINTFDYLNNSWHKCGVRIINVRLDNKLIYSHTLDEFSFAETRYINSHIDYEEKIQNNTTIQKTFLEPNNRLSIYNHIIDNGVIEFHDGKIHEVEISVADFNDNHSTVSFKIQSDTVKSSVPVERKGIMMPFSRSNEIKHHDIRLSFPAYCFYDTVFFDYRKAPPDRNGLYSDLHFLHNKYTPVHSSLDIAIKVSGEIDAEHADKLCLVYIDGINVGSMSFAGGQWNNGFIEGKVRDLGIYAIGIDTVAPEIYPVSFHDGATLGRKDELKISVNDDFSGIGEYEAFIDGKWALFEWDPKNSLLVYRPDEDYISPGSKHKLELRVRDNRDNESLLQLEFYW